MQPATTYGPSYYPYYPYPYPYPHPHPHPHPQNRAFAPSPRYYSYHQPQPFSNVPPPSSAPVMPPPSDHVPNAFPEYVIWSRRPSDPAAAPGMIISPRARPPNGVVQKALRWPSPPPSPPPTEVLGRAPSPTPTPPAETETTPATSTAPDTSVSPSPASSSTSLSAPDSPTPRLPAPKPSWASLLRGDASKHNALPTSSVVGFSVPASEPPARPAPSTKKPELLSLLASGPSSQPAVQIRPRGLVNAGNMCFANAVLQALLYCPPFWRLFHELGNFPDPDPETPLVDATVRFLAEFVPRASEGKGKAVDRTYDDDDGLLDSFVPSYVYDALKEKKRFDHMRGGHQEDAEEFLGFYLDTLEEELLSISSSLAPESDHAAPQNGHATQEDGPWLEVGKRNRTAVTRTSKSTESPITRMFGGKFRSTLRVPHQKDSVLVEDWRSLRLDIQREQIHTIRDALAYTSTPQSVQVTSVTRPGATLDATQTVHIDSLPPILILHLKRFLYDANAGGVAKVGKQVSFTPELDVPTEIMAPGKKLYGTRYKLFGVLYHHGASASGGHYTIDVLHPNIDNTSGTMKPREGWVRIDDELVSDVRPEDVFEASDRDDRCAYLLFYRRVGTTPRS